MSQVITQEVSHAWVIDAFQTRYSGVCTPSIFPVKQMHNEGNRRIHNAPV